jgi:hypothetical protein
MTLCSSKFASLGGTKCFVDLLVHASLISEICKTISGKTVIGCHIWLYMLAKHLVFQLGVFELGNITCDISKKHRSLVCALDVHSTAQSGKNSGQVTTKILLVVIKRMGDIEERTIRRLCNMCWTSADGQSIRMR